MACMSELQQHAVHGLDINGTHKFNAAPFVNEQLVMRVLQAARGHLHRAGGGPGEWLPLLPAAPAGHHAQGQLVSA